MGVRKVYDCDVCKQEISGKFYSVNLIGNDHLVVVGGELDPAGITEWCVAETKLVCSQECMNKQLHRWTFGHKRG